jgi:hypothetical protein
MNERASRLAHGTVLYGIAIIIPDGWKGKFLYNLMR